MQARLLSAIMCVLLAVAAARAQNASPAADTTHDIIQFKAPANWKSQEMPGGATKVYASPRDRAMIWSPGASWSRRSKTL